MTRPDLTPAALAAIFVLLASPALAQDLSPVSDMIDNIIEAVTGPIGRGLAVLALVGSGVMMFFGRLNWPIFVAVFVGVVMIFSAETIIDGFATPT
ncbi:MAG: TrbC/VirB2 family protein [Marinovum algicola]|uniref:TrbC/VirB2 family protein n=1 Tax=Alphaproteobacteria TaxID=28211 RepID=UPI0032EB76E7